MSKKKQASQADSFSLELEQEHTMGLDQLQIAPLVLDDSLLHLFTTQGKVFMMQHKTFFIQD